MTTILEEIAQTHQRLGDLLSKLSEAAPPPAAITTVSVPAIDIELQPGEHYAGLILGEGDDPAYHLILLPGEAESVSWDDAKTWAASVGGRLPNRREQALLFANVKSQFQAAWYWSSEQHETNGSCAWFQNFDYGDQDYYLKSYEARASAVRSFED